MPNEDSAHIVPDEPVEPTPEPALHLSDLLAGLESDQAEDRLQAIEALGRLDAPGELILTALEKVAAHDPAEANQRAALQRLTAPGFQRLQQQRSRLPASTRRLIVQEISGWQTDGLIDGHTAQLLQQRYRFDRPAAPPAESAPPAPPRSLSEVLLSETAIRVALYLGAFFVISAACIFATAVEELRLPILGLATAGFLIAALILKPRLPQASFIFSIIFSFMLPLDAAVLYDQLGRRLGSPEPFWMVILFVLSLIWGLGTLFYRSRIFSVLTLLGLAGAMLALGRWFDQTFHLDIFLIALVMPVALGGVYGLRRWQGMVFAWPLFWSTQAVHLGLLAASAAILTVQYVESDLPDPLWWLLIGPTWLLGAIFYLGSQALFSFILFPILAVVTLIPVPMMFSGLFSPSLRVVLGLTWLWATLFAGGGEALHKVKRFALSHLSPILQIASAMMYLVVATISLGDRVALGLAYLIGITVVYLALALYRPRVIVFGGALLAATAAYLSIFALPSVTSLEIYPGFILLWPALLLLGGHVAARRLFKLAQSWYLPPVVLGVFIGLADWGWLLIAGFEEPVRSTIGFLIWALFLAGYSILDRRPAVSYGATGTLAAALFYLSIRLAWFEDQTWMLPFVVLASGYYLAGLVLDLLTGSDGYAQIFRQSEQRRFAHEDSGGTTPPTPRPSSNIGHTGSDHWANAMSWANALRWSGLGLGVLAALSAPLQGGATAIIGVAMIAAYFTVEAFRRRNIWFGLPANLLYLGAYMLVLWELSVDQPQFYSVGAALMGFIMHYLLVRSGSRVVAFISGVLSQLILLGTTYIQMAAGEQLIFFVVLFLQALVVLGYGLVIRAKSLVIAPIFFVVLGVITAAFSVFAGIPTIILIGCTGLLLLGLGILALVMRERLIAVTDRLGERLGGWRA